MTSKVKPDSAAMILPFAPLLKIKDLEGILRIDRRTIFRLCHNGQLPPPLRIGGGLRWKAEDIARLFNSTPDATTNAERSC